MLRADGTCWLNIGDSYSGDAKWGGRSGGKNATSAAGGFNRGRKFSGLKPKDLCMIPARVALALQADGWYLRSTIIWAKPNPMPESVTDRPTRSHEYVLLLAKSGQSQYWSHPRKRVVRSQPESDYVWIHKHTGLVVGYPPVSERLLVRFWSRMNLWEGHDYYYDREAVMEPLATDPRENYPARARITGRGQQGAAEARGNDRDKSGGFPPCYKGSPFDRGKTAEHELGRAQAGGRQELAGRNLRDVWTIATQPFSGAHFACYPERLVEPCILAATSEKGCCPKCWAPSCACEVAEPVPCTVLDPFCGSGTTAVVARRDGRAFIGIELNAHYCALAVKRLSHGVLDLGDAPC